MKIKLGAINISLLRIKTKYLASFTLKTRGRQSENRRLWSIKVVPCSRIVHSYQYTVNRTVSGVQIYALEGRAYSYYNTPQTVRPRPYAPDRTVMDIYYHVLCVLLCVLLVAGKIP